MIFLLFMNLPFGLNKLIDIVLNLDKYLTLMVNNYGIFTYIILFIVIFMETGFVVTPFLPGDSILFAAGALAALGSMNIITLFLILFLAAFLGDTVNYWIGFKIGPAVFNKDSKFIKKEYLERTKMFYQKHGGKTIVLARFIPIIRTFAPFVAGVGIMSYKRFVIFNLLGGFLWTSLFVFSGYFFGNISFVRNNFELVILFIVLISIVPVITEVIRSKKKKD